MKDYLGLLDRGGRVAHSVKRGVIPTQQPRLLTALDIDPEEWLPTVKQIQRPFELCLGTEQRLRQMAAVRE